MQLLYPIGLLALAGLIIPVIIHLWSVKQGKTLKIGSISLLGESASATSKSFKLTDWLLFVLRCLILILIAFILTQPFLKEKIKANSNAGWVLVQPAQFATIYQNHKNSIDSLLNLGFELHQFNLGFKRFELADTLNLPNQTSTLTYTSLLKKLNSTIPKGYKAYVFADHKQISFAGDLPKTTYKLIWKNNVVSDTVKNWSTRFFGKNYEAKSTPSLTNYTVAAPTNLPTLSISIFDPASNDSKYVRSAINAIKDFTQQKIVIESFNTADNSQADVVFWLSEQDINPYLAKLKSNTKVFIYQKGKILNVNSSLNLANHANDDGEIRLYQYVSVQNPKGKIIWTDGFGEPILLNQIKNKLNFFHFYTRFNPQWTDLVWNEKFVTALMPIILGQQEPVDFGFETHRLDQRLISKNQPINEVANTTSLATELIKNKPLDQILWIFAFCLLLIERILSFRKTRLDHAKN